MDLSGKQLLDLNIQLIKKTDVVIEYCYVNQERYIEGDKLGLALKRYLLF